MKLKFSLFFALILLSASFIVTGCGPGSSSNSGINPASGSGDAVKFSFAALGDTQIGKVIETDPSTTNIPQLRQTITDINKTASGSMFIVIIGDIVRNLAQDDGDTLKAQLEAWQDLFKALPFKSRIPILPIAGNHESNFEVLDPVKTEAPNPGAISEWLAWFVHNKYDFGAGNGPTTTGDNPDCLVRDESKLTYSFNRGGIHFVVINTDTLCTNTDATTGFPLAGWIAINWIENDLAQAQLDPSISTIILAGHKPVEMPPFSSEDDGIINTPQYPLADRLSSAMSNADKVKLYLACHCHAWDAIKLNNGNGVWQVIAGNGGAPIDKEWNPDGGVYYGYSLIDIHDSGKIVLSNYGRDLPPPPQEFYEDTPVAPKPATLRNELVIYSP